MDLATFAALTDRIATNHALVRAADAGITSAIRNEWYEFSTRTRCEHGAQGIEATLDSAREDTLPYAVRLLAGPVPVDFLFAETREAAKDAYRALCAAVGDPSKAAEQVEAYEHAHTPVQAGAERDKAEWLRLAQEAGLAVPNIPVEVFAQMTRAEFDAAVEAVDALREDAATFRDAADATVVEAWTVYKEGLRAEFGTESTFNMPTKALDEELLYPCHVGVGHDLLGSVPLAFLVEDTREQFKTFFRSDYEHMVGMQRDEEEHQRLMAQAERKEAARREFYALGKRLGYVTDDHKVVI